MNDRRDTPGMGTAAIVLAVLAAIVVAGTGLAIAGLWFYRAAQSAGTIPGVVVGMAAPQVRIELGEVHRFGVIRLGRTMEHTFTFQNDGAAALTLAEDETSCSCAVAEIVQASIPPGQSAAVVLRWTAELKLSPGEPFRHWARLRTNDPRRPRITLTVEGQVVSPVVVEPAEIVLTRAATGQTSERQLRLLSDREDFRITAFELADAATAPHFVLPAMPLSAARQDDSAGGPAWEIILPLTIKSGLPLGPLKQTIRLTTTDPDLPQVEIPVRGEIVPDVLVSGPYYRERTGTLTLGRVARGRGVTRALDLVALGPHRGVVRPRITEVHPPSLVVSVAAGRDDAQAESVSFPLTVEVPPAAPPVELLGPEPDAMGRIVLDTEHPDVPQIVIHVQFAVDAAPAAR